MAPQITFGTDALLDMGGVAGIEPPMPPVVFSFSKSSPSASASDVQANWYSPLRIGDVQCTHRLLDANTDEVLAFKDARTVFHGKCPDAITDDDIWRQYAELGEDAIVGLRWINDPSGKFRGFGFVEFKTPELAKQVCGGLDPPSPGALLDNVCRGSAAFKPAGLWSIPERLRTIVNLWPRTNNFSQ